MTLHLFGECMLRNYLLSIALFLFVFNSCSDQIHDVCELEDAGFKGTYSEVQKEVFNKYCIGCHGGSQPKANLVLTSATSYQNIVAQLNTNATDTLIVPGVPGRSYLLKRMTSTGDDVMPPSGNLNENLLNLMETWVAAGAEKN